MSDFEKKLDQIFFEVTGYETMYPWLFLYPYVLAGSDEETLWQIRDLAKSFDDPEKAELGFITVWKYLEKNRSLWGW